VRTINASAFMPSRIDLVHQNNEPGAHLNNELGAPSIPRFFNEKMRNGWETTEVGPYFINALGSSIKVASPLTGAHQQRNIALAIAAAVELSREHGFPITPQSITNGIRNTEWPGRLELIDRGGISWILDVAHNPAGAWALRSGLNCLLSEKHLRCLVFSCLRDKPLAEMAQILFPLFEQVIFAPIHSARAAAMEDLAAAAQLTRTPFLVAESVAAALQLASKQAGTGPIVVSGSVYLVGEVRSLLAKEAESKGSTT